MSRRYVLIVSLSQKSVEPCQDSRIFQTYHIFVIIAHFFKWRMPLCASLTHIFIREPLGVYIARKLFESLVGSLRRYRGYKPLSNPSVSQVTYLNYPFRLGFEPVLLPFVTKVYAYRTTQSKERRTLPRQQNLPNTPYIRDI